MVTSFVQGIAASDICMVGTPKSFGNAQLKLHNGFNVVDIGDGLTANSLQGSLLGGAALKIGANCGLGHAQIHLVAGAKLTIGAQCSFNGRINLFLHEPSQMTIGTKCLFGGDVLVSTSDMHSIVDLDTGERINWAADIEIGDNVWVGAHSTILKGVRIGSGAVIGAYAVVTGDIPENCVVAGNPARIVRRNASWRRELIPKPPSAAG